MDFLLPKVRILPRSIFDLTFLFLEPHWKEHRKIITPAFHFKILENSIEVFHNNTEALLQSLSKVANGDVVDIYPHISRYSLDVIAGKY